jgi:hypothetical protein
VHSGDIRTLIAPRSTIDPWFCILYRVNLKRLELVTVYINLILLHYTQSRDTPVHSEVETVTLSVPAAT